MKIELKEEEKREIILKAFKEAFQEVSDNVGKELSELFDENDCKKMKDFSKVLKEKDIIRYLSEYENTINIRNLLNLLNETKEYDHIFEKEEWKKINALYDLLEIEKNYERENVSF